MTKQQNAEFTLRVTSNVLKLMAKGLSKGAAQKRVFNALNAEFPNALAAWLKVNE